MRRPEFKKLGESISWLGFRFRSGKDRDFQLWEGIRDERVGRPKKICKLYVAKGGLHVKECKGTGW